MTAPRTTSFSKSGPGSLGTQDHIYADGPNDYTVTVKVTEAGMGTPPSGQATFAVHVNNVAPTGTLGNNWTDLRGRFGDDLIQRGQRPVGGRQLNAALRV